MVADKNLGQLWLDARVVCHESKEGHIGPGITSAGGFFAMRFARRQRMLRNDETLPFPIAVANSRLIHINEQWDLPLVARVSPDTLCPLQKRRHLGLLRSMGPLEPIQKLHQGRAQTHRA